MIQSGDYGSDVDVVRRRLGLVPGRYDESCAALVKGIGSFRDHDNEGHVDELTAELIGEAEANTANLVPIWFEDQNDSRLAVILKWYADRPATGIDMHADLPTAIKRWQGSNGFVPTGIVTPEQAILLGE